MTRKLLALALLAWIAPPAAAQDMPLSQILIDGEGWKKAEKRDGGFGVSFAPPHARTPDGTTEFRWLAKRGAFIEARPSGAAQPYAPYCPLRTKRGEESIHVTSLTTDRDGRIYAATEIGVQVFDPTGRLCGVLTPAAPGKPEAMAFAGDKLTLWIGGTKYERKLNTQGTK